MRILNVAERRRARKHQRQTGSTGRVGRGAKLTGATQPTVPTVIPYKSLRGNQYAATCDRCGVTVEPGDGVVGVCVGVDPIHREQHPCPTHLAPRSHVRCVTECGATGPNTPVWPWDLPDSRAPICQMYRGPEDCRR